MMSVTRSIARLRTHRSNDPLRIGQVGRMKKRARRERKRKCL